MKQPEPETTAEAKPTSSRFGKFGLKKAAFNRFGKYSFWIWVGYQAVKGTLTTVFIWGPLIYMHFFS